MTLYFNAAVDSDYFNVLNWWQDAECSVQADAIPTSADYAVFLAKPATINTDNPLFQPPNMDTTACGGVDVGGSYGLLAIEVTGDISFVSGAGDVVGGSVSGTLTSTSAWGVLAGTHNIVVLYSPSTGVGEATCNSLTVNGAVVSNMTATDAVFNDTSQNSGTVTNGTFAAGTTNIGTITNATNFAGTNSGTITNLFVTAVFESGRWRVTHGVGGTVTNVIITNIGTVPAASDVRAGTSVGVSPAVGTLAVPSAANVRLGTAVDAGTGTAAIPAASSVRSGVAVDATTGTLVVPSAANVRLGTSVGVPPAAGTCAVPAASDVRLGVAVDATTGTLLTYTDPANPADMPDEHSIAFQEMLVEFGVTYTFGGFSFLCVESDVSQSLEPILEGDFKNDTAPIIALKTAFNTCPSGTPEIGDILVDPDGREFRVKSFRTSQDDVTIQLELTDIHDRG